MSEELNQTITEAEMEASERRAARLREIMEEQIADKDSEMAKLLAEMERNNNKR